MALIHSPSIVMTNLVNYYDPINSACYPGSGTTCYDISGNNITGTLTNATYDSTYKAFSFNGTTATVNFTYDLRTDFTFECWAYHNAVSGFSFLGQGSQSPNAGLHIWFGESGGSATNLRFGLYGNDVNATISTTSINTWYHYTFTYSHSSPYTKKIYRNGVELTTTPSGTQAQYTGTGTVRIGATYGSGGNYANGYITNTKLYNRVLSAGEILKNYNTMKSRYGL